MQEYLATSSPEFIRIMEALVPLFKAGGIDFRVQTLAGGILTETQLRRLGDAVRPSHGIQHPVREPAERGGASIRPVDEWRRRRRVTGRSL